MLDIIVWLASLAWLALLVLPTRSWLNGEVLDDAGTATDSAGGANLTVLVPARNEADYIGDTLVALRSAAPEAAIVVIDDGSTDGTAEVVQSADPSTRVVKPSQKPGGWSGKLWALQQGLGHVTSEQVLLIDADITVDEGFLCVMQSAMHEKQVSLLSIMARLRTRSLWEKLLIPAFVFFFKQVYPFRLSNSSSRLVAAAAGGCILIETRVLREIGGFEAIRGEIIDDCALARRIKDSGRGIWIGLSHRVTSRRVYDGLSSIWTMVDRTAFCQLRYSIALLLVCSVIMAVCFWGPLAGIVTSESTYIGVVGFSAMAVSYLPTLAFYRQSPAWALAMPLIGTLYLAMTWSSAVKHLAGAGVEWKGRQYR